MKKTRTLLVIALLTLSMLVLASCTSKPNDPGTPPEEVINPVTSEPTELDTPDSNSTESPSDQTSNQTSGNAAYEGDILEGATSVRIGRSGQTEFNIDMYNNDAATTMLDYLSNSALLFPTYTYDEEQGFVAQSVRGNYSRDDEVTVTDVHTGELYLFSGGQLRFYFKDVAGANITATPIGYFTDTENLTETVQEAYESNLGDTWNVDVYFWITKTID